jgi:hypothetical protein
MEKERYEKLKGFNDTHEDMPDGAFFALAEEHGIDVYDWDEFYDKAEMTLITIKNNLAFSKK